MLTNFLSLLAENHVQKIRHKFNNPRSLASHVNLADMSLELRLRPPSVIDSSVTAPSSFRQSHIGIYAQF